MYYMSRSAVSPLLVTASDSATVELQLSRTWLSINHTFCCGPKQMRQDHYSHPIVRPTSPTLSSRWRTVVILAGCIVGIVACEQVPSVPRGVAPGSSTIISPSDTGDTVQACTQYDAGHCNFIAVTHDEFSWMQEAADKTVCPDLKRLLQTYILKGWINKLDMQPWTPPGYPKVPNGDAHIRDWGYPFGGSGRIHLDHINAFTGPGVTAAVMRHEGVHIFYPWETDENVIENVAQACSPH